MEPLTPQPHVPVLLEEVLHGLQVRTGGVYIDGTVGAGGHSAAILQAADSVRLLGLDVDPSALNIAGERLKTYIDQGRVRLVQSNFAKLDEVAQREGLFPADGVLLDLG